MVGAILTHRESFRRVLRYGFVRAAVSHGSHGCHGNRHGYFEGLTPHSLLRNEDSDDLAGGIGNPVELREQQNIADSVDDEVILDQALLCIDGAGNPRAFRRIRNGSELRQERLSIGRDSPVVPLSFAISLCGCFGEIRPPFGVLSSQGLARRASPAPGTGACQCKCRIKSCLPLSFEHPAVRITLQRDHQRRIDDPTHSQLLDGGTKAYAPSAKPVRSPRHAVELETPVATCASDSKGRSSGVYVQRHGGFLQHAMNATLHDAAHV